MTKKKQSKVVEKNRTFLDLKEDLDEMSDMALREVPVYNTEDEYAFSKIFLEFHVDHFESGVGAVSLSIYEAEDIRKIAGILSNWADKFEKKIGKKVRTVDDYEEDINDVVKN